MAAMQREKERERTGGRELVTEDPKSSFPPASAVAPPEHGPVDPAAASGPGGTEPQPHVRLVVPPPLARRQYRYRGE